MIRGPCIRDAHKICQGVKPPTESSESQDRRFCSEPRGHGLPGSGGTGGIHGGNRNHSSAGRETGSVGGSLKTSGVDAVKSRMQRLNKDQWQRGGPSDPDFLGVLGAEPGSGGEGVEVRERRCKAHPEN